MEGIKPHIQLLCETDNWNLCPSATPPTHTRCCGQSLGPVQYFPIFSNCLRWVIQRSQLYIPPTAVFPVRTLSPQLAYQTWVPNQISASIYFDCLVTVFSMLVACIYFQLDCLNVRFWQTVLL